jgi:hypothetical protein
MTEEIKWQERKEFYQSSMGGCRLKGQAESVGVA